MTKVKTSPQSGRKLKVKCERAPGPTIHIAFLKFLEHEHYGSSKKRGAWSGDLLHMSVEEYHASYMSIHWWPREELKENLSVSQRDGNPQIALPLPGDAGQRRCPLGTIRLTPAK